MADAHEEKGTTILPWIHELLPKIHQELFEGRKGAHPAYRDHRLDMGKTPGRRLQGAEAPNG